MPAATEKKGGMMQSGVLLHCVILLLLLSLFPHSLVPLFLYSSSSSQPHMMTTTVCWLGGVCWSGLLPSFTSLSLAFLWKRESDFPNRISLELRRWWCAFKKLRVRPIFSFPFFPLSHPCYCVFLFSWCRERGEMKARYFRSSSLF